MNTRIVCENCMFFTYHKNKTAKKLKPFKTGFCLSPDFNIKKFEPHKNCPFFLPDKND